MFSSADLQHLKSRGNSKEEIERQLECFRKGFPPLPLVAPATLGNGMLKYSDDDSLSIASRFSEMVSGRKLLKFVPASGAASRMFKNLLSFRHKNLNTADQVAELEKDHSFDSPWYFFENLGKFAFYEDLEKIMADNGKSLYHALLNGDYYLILDFFLNDEGLGYAGMPKALLRFHTYNEGPRTSLGEHLVEAVAYATSTDGISRIHFTVSEEHRSKFEQTLKEMLPCYEKKLNARFEISLSVQSPSTDTIAVDMNNEPLRDENGTLLFRPGGHGALIKNLNELDADLIFIKNIDNVVPDKIKKPTILYKKLLAVVLLQLQQKTFEWITELEKSTTEAKLTGASKFLENELMLRLPSYFSDLIPEEKKKYILSKLNRPLRVCGMVKNEGEPGGGPFWVKNSDGSVSLHIVESSQINTNDPVQAEIFRNATHFNPVDLVCATKDYKGHRFNLNQFIDPQTGFISKKSHNGRDLKALELPGLWNGAMADWNTVFVEVPIITFNPVKTINDLLREEHI